MVILYGNTFERLNLFQKITFEKILISTKVLLLSIFYKKNYAWCGIILFLWIVNLK